MSEHEKVKRPASQYYWGDWFRDLALQSCSQPARGLWHEMNCLMHQGEPYGHLTMPNGKPMGPEQLANLCKITPATCRKLLAELDSNGVSSTAESGAIYSRRMVRDEKRRQELADIGRANGAKGAEHGAKGAEHGKKGGRPPVNNPPPEPPHGEPPGNPPSSTSPSSATSPSGVSEPAVPLAPPPLADDADEAAFDLACQGQPPAPAKRVRNASPKPPEDEGPTVAVWRAYSFAYAEVYGADPPKPGPKTNGQLMALIRELGKEDAVQVAAFYVRQPFYRGKLHEIGNLVIDARGLHTRWKLSLQGRGLPDPATVARPDARTQSRNDRMREALGADNPAVAGNSGARQAFDIDLEPTDGRARLSRT